MNRTTKTLLIAGLTAIVGSAVVAGTVKARDGHSGMRGERHGMNERGGENFGRGNFAMMEQYDTNKDGNLTQAEIDQGRKDRLIKFDTNKDGKLNLKEFEALWLDHTRQQMVRSFQHLDSDGDAIVTTDEYVKPFHRMVDRADRNNDGQLNKDDRRRFGPRGDAPKGEPKAAPK